VEREVDKKDAAMIMPVIREHLDVCPECCEEYETLLNVINHLEEETRK
jgi:predicted anti-sigma-YlaC factor YlaD